MLLKETDTPLALLALSLGFWWVKSTHISHQGNWLYFSLLKKPLSQNQGVPTNPYLSSCQSCGILDLGNPSGPSALLCHFLWSVLWVSTTLSGRTTGLGGRLQNVSGKNNEASPFCLAGNNREKGVNRFVQHWTLARTRPRLTPSPHQPFCRPLSMCKHVVKDEWWCWLLLGQNPLYHELWWFEKGSSPVFVAELGNIYLVSLN